MRLIRDAVPSSVDVPSSGRLMTGRLVFSSPGFRSVHTLHVHDWKSNDIARSVNAFPRVDMLSLLRFTRSALVLFHLRPKSHRLAHRGRAVCNLRERTEVLFTERINHWFPEAVPPFQVSLASWEPIVPSNSSDLQPHVQPIIDEPIINGAMQEVVQLSEIKQLCENVTHAENTRLMRRRNIFTS